MTTATDTSRTAGSLQLAAAARQMQLAVRAQVMRDVTRLWPSLDAQRLDETFPGWLRAMLLIVGNYHRQSATAAGRFYQVARAAAVQSPTPASLIKIADAPAVEWMTRAFGYSGPGLLSREAVRPGTALSTTLGTAARIALDGGRSTITGTVQADPVAVGYYRVTDGHPCAFCALLAGRGIVYKQDTAGFKSHNDCGCMGAPAFSSRQPLPAVNQRAAQVYLERGGGDALKAFRAAWDAHQTAVAA